MKKLMLLAGAICLSAFAASVYPPVMTGELLVRKFVGPPGLGNKPLAGNDYLEHETARGYLSGIKDATEGAYWCYAGRLKPDELDWQVIEAVKALSPAQLKRNAANLVVDALKQKYPCAASDRKGN